MEIADADAERWNVLTLNVTTQKVDKRNINAASG